MDIHWIITWIVLLFREFGECLKCFECDNKINPACGVEFKSYQFKPVDCDGEHHVKCGLQRQEPQVDKENFVGILRRCYHFGTLPGMNETDGCHLVTLVTLAGNFSFEMCLCSQDYCNASPPSVTSVSYYFLLCACLVTYLILVRR